MTACARLTPALHHLISFRLAPVACMQQQQSPSHPPVPPLLCQHAHPQPVPSSSSSLSGPLANQSRGFQQLLHPSVSPLFSQFYPVTLPLSLSPASPPPLSICLCSAPSSNSTHLSFSISPCGGLSQLVLRGMSEALVDRRAAPALITLCSGPEL